MHFPVHTAETAPPAAKADMTDIQSSYGMIPNMLGTMAGSPALLKSYRFLRDAFEETSLTSSERNVVLLTVRYENECQYCMAAHTVIAHKQKVPAEVVKAIRDGKQIEDQKLEALSQFTRILLSTRGWPSQDALRSFVSAGFTENNALEVILGIGMKTLSNYTNHLANPPVDDGFSAASWNKPA